MDMTDVSWYVVYGGYIYILVVTAVQFYYMYAVAFTDTRIASARSLMVIAGAALASAIHYITGI